MPVIVAPHRLTPTRGSDMALGMLNRSAAPVALVAGASLLGIRPRLLSLLAPLVPRTREAS